MSAVRQVIVNATLFDSASGTLRPRSTIVMEGERITTVTQEPVQVDEALLIDAEHRVVLPGLIDAHVHVVAASHDLVGLAQQPPSLVGAQSSHIMHGMLRRGFTTVRDAAGADFGLQEAVARGLYEGPRLFIAGFPISQTGGHADMRPKGVRTTGLFCSCAGLGLIGAIADGVGEVRRAVRETSATARFATSNRSRSRSTNYAATPAARRIGSSCSLRSTCHRACGSRARLGIEPAGAAASCCARLEIAVRSPLRAC